MADPRPSNNGRASGAAPVRPQPQVLPRSPAGGTAGAVARPGPRGTYLGNAGALCGPAWPPRPRPRRRRTSPRTSPDASETRGAWGAWGPGQERASEAAPEAVRQAVGGGCQSGWGRLLSVTNAIQAGGRQWLGVGWAPWRGAGGTFPPSNASLGQGGCAAPGPIHANHGIILAGNANRRTHVGTRETRANAQEKRFGEASSGAAGQPSTSFVFRSVEIGWSAAERWRAQRSTTPSRPPQTRIIAGGPRVSFASHYSLM